jgi:Tn3 transposase DDE domain
VLPSIGAWLNRGEARHRLARAVFHGQRGELRQRYREGQEDQLGALGLVVNAIILWNTRYMERAITQLQGYGLDIRPEEIARLSPLGLSAHKHLSGRFFPGRGSSGGGWFEGVVGRAVRRGRRGARIGAG